MFVVFKGGERMAVRIWAMVVAVVLALWGDGAAAQGRIAEPGFDRPGGDYFSFELPGPGLTLCQQACFTDGRCHAYTYVESNGSAPARCYLKNVAPEPRPSACCTSGVRQSGQWVEPAMTPAPVFPTPDAVRQVGWRRMTRFGVIPVLTVIAQYPLAPAEMDALGRPVRRNPIPAAQDAAFYDQMIFGAPRGMRDEDQSVRSFYWTASGGRLLLTRAATYGVSNQPRADPDPVDDAVRIADEYGFDFSAYDRDEDGIIRPDELIVLKIDNISDSGGAMRDRPCATTDDRTRDGSRFIVVCHAAGVGFASRMLNPAHEIGHLLGASDLYGMGCWSDQETLMSCTATLATARDRYTGVNFDPWHRMAFGWATPRFATTAGGEFIVSRTAEGLNRPLILYDPARGLSEYYVVEYRSAFEGGVDSGFAGGIAAIVWWYVKTDPNGFPEAPMRLIGPGDDNILDTVPSINDVALDSNGDGRNDTIWGGRNGLLETTPAATDAFSTFLALYATANPRSKMGGGAVPERFTSGLQPRLFWGDGTEVGVGVTIQLNPANPDEMIVRIEENRLLRRMLPPGAAMPRLPGG